MMRGIYFPTLSQSEEECRCCHFYISSHIKIKSMLSLIMSTFMLLSERYPVFFKRTSYSLAVAYRFIVAFFIGYFCTQYLSQLGIAIFHHSMGKAEAIYLSAFISLIFFTFFIISCFCIQSLFKITFISAILFSALFVFNQFVG